MSDTIILKNVGEKFRLYRQNDNNIKSVILGLIRGKGRRRKEFWALSDINFEIKKGEIVGFVGENGSGKTTLLNLIAGILKPDAGSIEIKGRVSALLELGTGFHPELSGRENIYLYGAVLGLSKKIIDSKFEGIVGFAELERFIDAPVKTYSAGMYVRLGFAVAINVDPDILLIDEVLAVGDLNFQVKCIEKIKEFKTRGKTMVLVSHNMALISSLCSRVVVLKAGRIIYDGQVESGISHYFNALEGRKDNAILKHGNSENLEVIFSNGRLLFNWKNKMLSKSLGGYISLKSSGTWHDSTFADWDIEIREQDRLVVNGRWLYLPISQKWKVKILDNNIIVWEIDIVILNEIYLEREQTSVMLSEQYKGWFNTKGAKGKFPTSFNEDYGGDWEILWSNKANDGLIGLSPLNFRDYTLPSIIFDCSNQPKDYEARIINSDRMFESRVLQCIRINNGNKAHFSPCKYRYFSGEIKINPQI